MTENATHVEGLEFRATDVSASQVADKIGAAFSRLHHATEKTRESIRESLHEYASGSLAAMGLGFGLHSIYEKAKEANFEMDRVRKSVAGAQFGFQGWNKGISQMDKMTHSIGQASEITEELEGMEVKLRTPLEELGQTFSQVAALGYTKLGMNQKQVVELTEEMSAAAKVYGISGSEAVSTVTRAMMTGRIRGFDPFQMAMKDALDLKSTGKQKGPVNAEEMFKKLEHSLKGMVPVARKIGDNMEGSMFEAHALVNKMLEDLGGPIFREQSKSLSEWVQKLRTIKEDGKSLVSIYGDKIASAFNTIKSAVVTIGSGLKDLLPYWKIFAGAWALSKVGKFAGAMSGGHGEGGAGGAMGTMNVTANIVNVNGSAASALGTAMGHAVAPGTQPLVGRLTGLASKAFVVTEALGALYIAANGAAQMVDAWQTKSINEETRWGEKGSFASGSGKRAADALAEYRKQAYLEQGTGASSAARATAQNAASAALRGAFGHDVIGKSGVNIGAAKSAYMAMDADTRKLAVGSIGASQDLAFYKDEKHADMFADKLAAVMKEIFVPGVTPGTLNPNTLKGPKGPGINIQNLTITQDFKEADPDRVFHKVTNEIAGLASSPGTSKLHVRGGM
jgi:hypothetical protein